MPIPREKVGEVPGGVVGDTVEHVSEPGLRVDAVELGGADQRIDQRRAFARSARSAALLVMQIRPSSRKRVNAGQRLRR